LVRRSLEELLAIANRALPSNALVRNRYAVYLLPRWGGSYAELDKFIEATVRQGAPGDVIKQLQAIKYDDIGFAQEEKGKHREAKENFEKALRLGEQVGGTFSVDFLSASRYYLCSGGVTSQSLSLHADEVQRID